MSITPSFPLPEDSHQVPVGQILQNLGVDPKNGLSAAEAKRRYKAFGSNALSAAPRKGWLPMLIRQFSGVIIWVLAGASCWHFVFPG